MMRVPVGLDLGLRDRSFLVFLVGHFDRYTQPLTFSSFLFALELHPGIFLAVYMSEFPRLRCLRCLLPSRVVCCSAQCSSVSSPVCFSIGVVSEGGSHMVATSSCVKLGIGSFLGPPHSITFLTKTRSPASSVEYEAFLSCFSFLSHSWTRCVYLPDCMHASCCRFIFLRTLCIQLDQT